MFKLTDKTKFTYISINMYIYMTYAWMDKLF